MAADGLYTMPSGVSFLRSLAEGLKRRYGDQLQDCLILLPTRRSVRELTKAFAGDSGVTVLPKMRPLADIDPDEPPFEPGYLTGLVDPVMPSAQRRFELAQIIEHFHNKTSTVPLDPAGALAMTDPLIAILDDAAMEEVPLARLARLEDIRELAARHFQNAALLYEIVQTHWPAHVASLGLMEPMARRVALLNALTRLWTEAPPAHPVIIAGSTGTLAATAKLMRCVLSMKDGMVILPGLDTHLRDEAWANVGPEHPQFSMKSVLERIGRQHRDVPTWSPLVESGGHQTDARRRVISESLVPVTDTSDWPERIAALQRDYVSGDIFRDALKGLSLIEAKTPEEEALSIALIMRDCLERPGETATLITPDAILARRVKARLRRWGVDVDVSQGEPLEETHIGAFLTGFLNWAIEPADPVQIASLFGHPLLTMGCVPGETRRAWQSLELEHFRGPRPALRDVEKFPPYSDLLSISQISDNQETMTVPDWAVWLARRAEALAGTPDKTGASNLWAGEAGEKAASTLSDLIHYGESFGAVSLTAFRDLLSTLMRGQVVRPQFGTHPNLAILGPLEARMAEADTIILAGLNEGIWPSATTINPFLSRTMRKELGLSLPEQRYGLAAHDFAELASGPNVILTRSLRQDDGPTVASRWLWRLATLAEGALGEDAAKLLKPEKPYLDWARDIDFVAPDDVTPARPPEPRPPLDKRWPEGERKLSVTRITKWVRDPYSIYGQYILGIEPLEALDAPLGPREYGTAIHDGLETFAKSGPSGDPEMARGELAALFETALIKAGYAEFHLIKERPRLRQTAEYVTDWMQSRTRDGWEQAAVEQYARYRIDEIDFTLSARVDRIERGIDGYAVMDYKTGTPPSVKVVAAGFDLQLPLTAIMLKNGAFQNIKPAPVAELNYVRVRGLGKGVEESKLTSGKNALTVDEYVKDALENLTKLVRRFDDPNTAYHSQPRIQYTYDYGDYDDLARRGEWREAGDDGGTNAR